MGRKPSLVPHLEGQNTGKIGVRSPPRREVLGGVGKFSGSYTATEQAAFRAQNSLFAARLPPGRERSVSLVTLFSRRVSLVSVPGGLVTVVTPVSLC